MNSGCKSKDTLQTLLNHTDKNAPNVYLEFFPIRYPGEKSRVIVFYTKRLSYFCTFKKNKKYKNSMFTVGLFSTHIPYLVFVFFYAFFFLFGYQKISDEKVLTDERANLHELILNTDNQFSHIKADFDFNDFDGTFSPEKGWLDFPDGKTERPIPPEKNIQQEDFNFFCFCRPPPTA